MRRMHEQVLGYAAPRRTPRPANSPAEVCPEDAQTVSRHVRTPGDTLWSTSSAAQALTKGALLCPQLAGTAQLRDSWAADFLSSAPCTSAEAQMVPADHDARDDPDAWQPVRPSWPRAGPVGC